MTSFYLHGGALCRRLHSMYFSIMYEADHLLRLIEPRLAELGMSQADFGEAAFGIRRNSAIQDLKKGSTPSIDRLAAMAAVLGFECYFGPPRDPQHAHLQATLREPAGNGPVVLGPPTGYCTFVWHHASDPGTGIPPVAVSQAWATRHGLDPDNHLTVALGPRPDQAQSPAALAVIDPAAPREGGPTTWAYRAARNAGVELGQVQWINARPLALPTPSAAELRDLSLPGAVLLGRVLWSASKPP